MFYVFHKKWDSRASGNQHIILPLPNTQSCYCSIFPCRVYALIYLYVKYIPSSTVCVFLTPYMETIVFHFTRMPTFKKHFHWLYNFSLRQHKPYTKPNRMDQSLGKQHWPVLYILYSGRAPQCIYIAKSCNISRRWKKMKLWFKTS